VDRDMLSEKYPDASKPMGMPQERMFEEVARRDRLDQHFTRIWLQYGTAHHSRPGLDTRTRLLTLAGQFAVTRAARHLEDALRVAFAEGVSPRELLEVVLQCAVYAGDVALAPALEIFERVADEAGVLEGLRSDQLPLDGRDRERDFERERATWAPEDRNDPRLERFLARLPWQAVSTGLRMKPRHHLDVLEFFDGVDADHTLVWTAFTYQGMYSRALLDERTRLLCIVANFIALGRDREMREHMGNALHAGATPNEIMELGILASLYFGMPARGLALRTLVEILKERGRLDELGAEPRSI
jgi:alkylhydroperoxidase/carboxymuconolactone decarboxylase family protein YurZ